MARNFVLSARVTADASGLKAGAEQGAKSARELGKALDDVADKARRADEALQDASNTAAKGVPTPASQPAPASSPRSPLNPPPRTPSAPAPSTPNLPAPRPTRPTPAPSAPGQLQDWQKTNLRSQYFDIGTSLYGGMNPLTVLSQQGPQIVEIYGGVGNALRGTATAIGGVGAAVAGVTAVVVAGAVAWSRYNSAREDAVRSLSGVGRGSGLTVDQLLQQQGAGLSRMESMQAASTFASSGRIGGGQISDLMGITRQYMRATGGDVQSASEELGQALANPAKGADDLNEKFGFLDATSRQLIRTLAGTGQTAAAQSVLFRLLAKDLKDVEDRSSGVNRTWEAIKRTSSNVATGFGKWVDDTFFGKSNADKLREEEEALAKYDPGAMPHLLQNAERMRQRIEMLRKLVDAEKKLAEDRAKLQDDNRGSIRRTDDVRSMLPDFEERARLERIQRSAREVLAGKPSDVSRDEARKVLDWTTHALNTKTDADERARRSDELSIRSIQARTAAQRGEIAAQRELLALAGSAEVSQAEKLRRSEEARRQVYAQEQRSAEDRARDARESAQLLGLNDFERGRREIQQRWARTLFESKSTPEVETLNRQAMDQELRTFTQSQQLAPLKQAKNGLLEQVAALERLQQTFGMTAGAVAEFAARQQLLNEYQRQGIPITTGLRAEIERYAVAQGRAAQANDDLQRAQERVVGAMDDVRAGARSAFSGLITNLRQGKSLSDSLSNSATQMLDRVFERTVTNPLVEMALGQNGKPGGGLFGDSVAKMLGGGQALSTANITAATVIVNGNALGASAIPGLGAAGVPGLAANSNSAASSSALALISQRYIGRPGGVEGLNGDFASRLAPFLSANPGVSVVSGYRSIEAQKQLWEQALQKYGSAEAARKWVAPPGSSEHNFGMAADLRFASDAARTQAHATAGQYGLNFRMANEPWHVSPNANWQGAPAPTSALSLQQVSQFDASLRRATEATDGLQGGFTGVSKTLSQGAGSLTQAASGVSAGASQFQSGANGIFSMMLGGIGQVGNSFVSGLGTALQTILQAISSQGGGGFGGLISSIFGGGGGAAGAPMQLASALPAFARGGVTNRPSIFGEAGPEAAVPLPDGKRIPVELRLTGARSGNDNAPMTLPLAALTGAVAKLNERVSSANSAGSGSSTPNIVIEDRVGVKKTEREEDAPEGGRRKRVILDEAIAGAAGRPNSKTRMALGLGQQVGRR